MELGNAACLTVDAEHLAHGALDVQHLDVVPVLLQQRDEEVDRHDLGFLNERHA